MDLDKTKITEQNETKKKPKNPKHVTLRLLQIKLLTMLYN